MPRNQNKKGTSGPKGESFGQAFSTLHPFENVFFVTDRYYNDIAKKIYPMLQPMIDDLECDKDIIKRIAFCLAAYFEDQVSEVGLWSAFIHRHRELYCRWLPWYDTTGDEADYYEDEINLQDVKFIIWMINVSSEEDRYTVPDHPTIESCAIKVFTLLEGEFEKAPINEALVDMIYSDKVTDDFYTLKKVFFWMTKACYLMAGPSWEIDQKEHVELSFKKMADGQGDKHMLSYGVDSYLSFHMRFGPLALYPNEWYVLMRRQKGIEKDNEAILGMKSSPMYPFLVVSNNGDTVTLRSCRGVDYDVDTASFKGDLGKTIKSGQIIVTTLASYKGHWLVNGLCSISSSNDPLRKPEKLIKDMDNHFMHNGQAVDFFAMPDTSVKNPIPSQWKSRLDEEIAQNNGDRLFYFPTVKEAMEWQQRIVGEKQIQWDEKYRSGFGDDAVMLFIDYDYVMRVLSKAYAVNDPSNPYYDPEKAYEASSWLYYKFGMSDEFVAYVVQQGFLKHLSFDSERPQPRYSGLIQDNLPFWATFMRQYPC